MHEIRMHQPIGSIVNSDVIFEVKRSGRGKVKRKLGELRVSKGNLTWFTGNGRKPYTITWKNFDVLMKNS